VLHCVTPVCDPWGVIGETLQGLTAEVELRRQRVSLTLDPTRRMNLGQFFTPDPVARFLASMFILRDAPATLLDPGAGVGSLAAAFVARWADECRAPLSVTACEVDSAIHDDLSATLEGFGRVPLVTTELIGENFIDWSADALGGLRLTEPPGFTHVVMNPPYRKLASDSHERHLLRWVGIETPNLYAAFVALGARLLAPGGQMVAITPRSFANGPYFKAFRRDLLSWVGLRRIHVYDSRDTAFADAEVLQENVVFMVERGADRRCVLVTSSASPSVSETTSRQVPFDEVVRPDDPEQFIHLAPHADHADIAAAVAMLPNTIGSLGASISTGRVVDFRSRDHLRPMPDGTTVPLVYPTHMSEGTLSWPKDGKKPNALHRSAETEKLLLPAGCYVLVKRFSAKEERRRVVASIVRVGDLPGDRWAFENHLNVFHCANQGLDLALAAGLTVWLNSTSVDVAFRQFSGHTQVNATDLRSMRYPTRDQLHALGDAAGAAVLTQEKVDALVSTHVAGLRV
jgi:adenine-specific DNA-methyltransferase